MTYYEFLNDKMRKALARSKSYNAFLEDQAKCDAFLAAFIKKFPSYRFYASSKTPLNDLVGYARNWEQSLDVEEHSKEEEKELRKLVDGKYPAKIERFAEMEKKAQSGLEEVKSAVAKEVIQKALKTPEVAQLIDENLLGKKHTEKERGEFGAYFDHVIDIFGADLKFSREKSQPKVAQKTIAKTVEKTK